MKRIHAVLLAGGLILLSCGCAASPPVGAVDAIGSSQDQPKQVDRSPVGPRPLLEAQGFAILDFRARRDEFDHVCVVGEVKNTGSLERGVELQATLRDTDLRVVAVGLFHPASYRNIKPGETWPFAYSFGRQEGVVRAELRIVGAFRAMDMLNVASASGE
jgi:hypothetical protein